MIDLSGVETFSPDHPLRELYRRAINKSMGGKPDNPIKQMRYYVMAQLAGDVLGRLGGDVMEFGCWKGHSTLMLASLLMKQNIPAKLHVFDSFEGLSEFSPEDKADRKPQDADRSKYATSADAFREMVKPLGFVSVHEGWIPDVFRDLCISDAVSFANIDVNLYDPTLAALEWVYPRMVEGGVIFFDDYGYKTCPGATKAIDEFLARNSTQRAMFVAMPFGSAFLVR